MPLKQGALTFQCGPKDRQAMQSKVIIGRCNQPTTLAELASYGIVRQSIGVSFDATRGPWAFLQEPRREGWAPSFLKLAAVDLQPYSATHDLPTEETSSPSSERVSRYIGLA